MSQSIDLDAILAHLDKRCEELHRREAQVNERMELALAVEKANEMERVRLESVRMQLALRLGEQVATVARMEKAVLVTTPSKLKSPFTTPSRPGISSSAPIRRPRSHSTGLNGSPYSTKRHNTIYFETTPPMPGCDTPCTAVERAQIPAPKNTTLRNSRSLPPIPKIPEYAVIFTTPGQLTKVPKTDDLKAGRILVKTSVASFRTSSLESIGQMWKAGEAEGAFMEKTEEGHGGHEGGSGDGEEQSA